METIKQQHSDVVIIGAGPAGLAAAVSVAESGARVTVLERDVFSGGILNQCIHNGFGLHTFKQELTGPEYAARYLDKALRAGVEIVTDTTVLSVTRELVVTACGRGAITRYTAGAVVFACGCRERPRGGIDINGTRPSGIFTAGTAQRLINIDGARIGSRVFILGSGDIGLIMARRMTFEGAVVSGVAEIMPYSSGLKRNVAQCLNDFNIPLMLSTTVVEVLGSDRLSGVVIADVDERRLPIMSTARKIDCDTLLLSVGLLPENELARELGVGMSNVTGGAIVDENFMTDVDGVFMCGNCLHVHDLVDFVSQESAAAGESAAKYASGERKLKCGITVKTSDGVRYCVPQKIYGDGELTLRMRVDGVYKDCEIVLSADGETLYSKRKRIVLPGEMETLTLPRGAVQKASAAESLELRLIRSDK